MSPKKYSQRLESLFTEASPEAADTPAAPSAGGNAFARFFELAADGFVVTEAGGTITHVNAAFARLTGLAAATVVGQPFLSLLHPDDHPAMSTLAPADPARQFTARTRSATAAWVRLAWNAHTDLAGEGYFTARPAQERDVLATLSEMNLGGGALETLRLLQRAIEAGEEAVSIADVRQPDVPLVYVNRAFEHTTGYSAAEALGRNCRFLQGADRHQPEIEDVRAALRAGRPCTVTLRNYRKDGTLFYNRLEMSPVRDEHGVVTHFLGLQNDVTAEVRAQQELERRNNELRAINAITRAVATRVDLQTLVDTAGQTMMDLFHVTAGYICLYDAEHGLITFPYYMDEGQRLTIAPRPLGQGLTSLVIQRRDALLLNGLDEAELDRLGAVKIQISGNGQPQSWLGVPMFNGNQVVGVLNVQDMPPGRFTPEDANLLATLAATLSSAIQNTNLAEEAHLYTDVMVNTPIGMYVWHLEDPANPASLRLVIANPASRAATGVDPATVLGKTINQAFPNLANTGIPDLYASIALGGTPTHLGEITYEDEQIGQSVFDVRAFPLPGQRTGVSFENITLSKQASQEFARLSAQQRAIVENAGYALIGTDLQGTVTLLNPAAADLLGYDPADVVGKHTPALWHDPLEVQARAATLTAELGQEVPVGFETFVIKTWLNLPNDYEWTFIRKDGRRVPVMLNISAMRSEQGEITGFVGIAADLTERKRAEQALADNQQRLIGMAENVPGLVYQFVLRPDNLGYFAFASNWVKTELGLDPADLRQDGQPLFALIHPDDALAFQQAVFASAQSQTVFRAEARLRRPDGSYLTTQWQSTPQLLPEGGVMWNGVLTDITERKQAEQALQASEERFRVTVERTGQLIYDYDIPADRLTWSGAIEHLTQFTAEEFAGVTLKRWETLIHPDDRAAAMHEFDLAMAEVREYREEYRFERKDGSYFYVRDYGVFLPGPDGRAIRMLGTMSDISEQKLAEQQLHESEQRFRALADATREGVIIHDQGIIMEANAAMTDLFGYTAEEIRGHNILDFVTPETRHLLLERMTTGDTDTYEAVGVRKDGTTFPMQAAGRHVPYAGKMMRGGIIRDLTERRKAEAELREAEERFRVLFESASIGFVLNEADGSYVAANTAYLKMLGRSLDELREVGYGPLTPPEYAERDLEAMHLLGSVGRYPTYEKEYNRPDGSRVFVALTGFMVSDSLGRQRIWSVAEDITERKQIEAANTRRARDLARVADISAAIVANQDVQAVAETVTRLTQRTFELYLCRIFLLDEAAQELVMAAECWEEGDPHAGTHGTARIPLHQEQSLVALAARTQQAVITNDTQNAPHLLPNALLPRTRVEMAVPMVIGGRLVGVFDVQADVRNVFDDIDQFIYTTLAAQVGASIQEARFFAEVSKRALEMETVARVSTTIASTLDPQKLLQDVVDLTKQAFNLYHAHIYLLNASGDKLMLTAGAGEVGRAMVAQGRVIPIESERSLVAQAARTRAGIIRNDARSDPSFLPNPLLLETRSELAVPLVVGDTVLGVFDVQADIVNRFTADDVRTQTTLAAQVAVAWQNAQRYEATRQRAERERLINDIAQKIQTAVTVPGALQVAAQELARATRAQQVNAELRATQPAPNNPVAGD